MTFAVEPKGEQMSDLIDRVEAIRAIKEYADKHAFNSYYNGMNRACKVLLTVPSAEPEHSVEDWKKDFKGYINALDLMRDRPV